MLEKELNLIFVSRLSPDGVISSDVCTFDCEYASLCRGNCVDCPPVKDRLAEVTTDQFQDPLKVVDITAYDLLSGIVGQIECARLESDYLLYKN
jgi:hypothetical protein